MRIIPEPPMFYVRTKGGEDLEIYDIVYKDNTYHIVVDINDIINVECEQSYEEGYEDGKFDMEMNVHEVDHSMRRMQKNLES